MTKEITRDEYAACLNTDFMVEVSPELKVSMKLTEVTELSERFHQQSFSLIFTAPDNTLAGQGQFSVEHETLGTIELFMVPIGKDSKGMLFQSLFNKLMEE